jgi:hypothetical protein
VEERGVEKTFSSDIRTYGHLPYWCVSYRRAAYRSAAYGVDVHLMGINASLMAEIFNSRI